MFEQKLREMYDARLSGVVMTDETRRAVLASARQRKNARRLSAAFVLTPALVLLSVGALAMTLAPSLEGWLRTLGSGASLTPDPIVGQAGGRTAALGDAKATLSEMLVDEGSFVVNVRFETDSGRQLIAYSGLKNELPPESNALYVSCEALRGETSNDIFTERTDGDALHILCEGLGGQGDELTLKLTCARYENGEWTIAKDVITATADRQPTLETAALAAPVTLGETGFALEQLTVTKTAHRLYRDVHIVRRDQALKYAVLPLSVTLHDESGEEIPRFPAYERGIPKVITVRVQNTETGDMLNETTLTLTKTGYEVK